MDNIAKYIDEEKDVAYLLGREKEKTELILNLLTQTDFSIDKISNLAGATVEFIQKVKETLISKRK